MFKVKYLKKVYSVLSVYHDGNNTKFLIVYAGMFKWIYAHKCEYVEENSEYAGYKNIL